MIVSLCPNTISYRSSHPLCRELFGRRWRRTPTTRSAVFFKKNTSHPARPIFSGFVGWNSFLVVVFNWSLWPSKASLDQSMLCNDERSKFKPAREVKQHRNQSEMSQNSLTLPRLIFTPLPCYPHYVAVQYLCIYFCCYLIIIIYCIRTRFALFEDEFQ